MKQQIDDIFMISPNPNHHNKLKWMINDSLTLVFVLILAGTQTGILAEPTQDTGINLSNLIGPMHQQLSVNHTNHIHQIFNTTVVRPTALLNNQIEIGNFTNIQNTSVIQLKLKRGNKKLPNPKNLPMLILNQRFRVNEVFEKERQFNSIGNSRTGNKIVLLGLFELTTKFGKRPEGLSELGAAQMAVQHINQKRLLPGYSLELLTNDTQVSNSSLYTYTF